MYQHRYDLVLAIRPSGWEKDSRPQYRGKINIIGVEYSEHSSYEEMKRFVKFLKPEKVISTVPTGRDLMVTPNVPEKWYKYDKLNTSTNYQPRIDQFLGKTPLRKAMIRMSNTNKEGLETFVSPLSKKQHKNTSQEINNNDTNDVDVITVPSISTSANEFDPPLILNQKQKIKNDKNNKENTIDVGVPPSQTKIKSEKLSPKIKTSPKKEVSDNSTMDVILSQGLKDGEMCSIFITNASSDYFEKSTSTSKSRCRRRIITSGSEDGRELPVSQKRKNVIKAKRKPFKPSMPPTKEENGEKFSCQKDENTKVVKENNFPNPDYDLDKPMTSKKAAELMLSLKKKNPLKSTSNSRTASLSYPANEEIASSQTSAYNRDITMTSKEPSELMLLGQKNPLLKSSSNSRVSSSSYSANEEIAASQTSDGRCRSIRSLRNKKQSSSNDTIPASQTTLDLANTPRPLRNKISQYIVIKSASQTSKDLEETPRAVRNKLLSCKNSQNDDIIPTSQTTADLACTPRPIRNKRLHSTPMSALTTSPPKKLSSPNESLSQPTKLTSPSGRSSAQLNINNDDEDVVACPVEEHSFTQSQLLTQIMKENQNVDIYNTSKLIDIVKDALADQKADASTDHIPLELLSDPDAEDDWID